MSATKNASAKRLLLLEERHKDIQVHEMNQMFKQHAKQKLAMYIIYTAAKHPQCLHNCKAHKIYTVSQYPSDHQAAVFTLI